MLAGFGGAIEALRAAVVMEADEVYDWNSRLHQALGLEPLEPAPPGSTGARAIFIGEGGPPAPPSVAPTARFLELLPVADADRPVPFGGRLQILRIERYDSAVAVAWRLAPPPDAELQYAEELRAHDRDTDGLPDQERTMMRQQLLHRLSRGPRHAMTLADDLGTEYRGTGGGASGSGNEQTGRSRFMPGIPPEASTLTVHWQDLAFLVALDGHDGARNA
jgi:hypothetical protein